MPTLSMSCSVVTVGLLDARIVYIVLVVCPYSSFETKTVGNLESSQTVRRLKYVFNSFYWDAKNVRLGFLFYVRFVPGTEGYATVY